ncbi:MAG: NADH-quinone oxidoreductase subunit N [Calditrichaeota bacterium]|nr:MAG: NADH-quinone oxidoreductase subunit N [Calditrichota bacterium]
MNEFNMTLSIVAPAIVLSVAGFVIVLINLFFKSKNRWLYLILAFGGLILSVLLILKLWNVQQQAFAGMIVADNFGLIFNFIFILGAGLSILLAMNQHEGGYLLYPEFFAVALFATVGMILMAMGTNLLTIFLGLETLSISLYVLAAFKRTEAYSLEAAFKYFLLGAFASGFLLYGIAMLYGATGSFDLHQISNFLATNSILDEPLILLGGLLIIVGFGFKIAMAPFHMWTPDVYQGAPTPIAAFMSTGSKAAGFVALMRVLFASADGTVSDWTTILWVLSVLTMFVGNISAIVQTNVKRMLAYSSIAHAGYILVGIVAWNELGTSSVVFYLLTYTFMNIGAFGMISFLSSREKEYLEFDDFKGLAFQRPLAAVVMAVFMFSLAGIPPTAGFMGKFYLFSAAVKANQVPLVILGVINSMISLYYYLGLVVVMFMKDSAKEKLPTVTSPAVAFSLLIAVIGTLGLGLFPSRLMELFQVAVSQIM